MPPYHANIRKRLVKRPRILWRDVCLLHYLLGVRDLEHLFAQPWVGHSWEGFVVEQTLASLAATGISGQPFYFRTSDGYELDLVLEIGTTRWAIEVKLTSSPTKGMLDRLHKTADMIAADRRVLVCRCGKRIETPELLVTNPEDWLRHLLSAGTVAPLPTSNLRRSS